MAKPEFENVMQTYIAMQKSKGMSVEASLKAVCEATGRKYNKAYLDRWPAQKSAIPDDAIAWMQQQCGFFACEMAGARISKENAKLISRYLLVPVKK